MDDLQLSAHFRLAEFCRQGWPTNDCLPVAREFCEKVLEPLRAWVGGPVTITSGYRPPAANAAAGGVPDSYHVWTPLRCAADVQAQGRDLVDIWDWLRLKSGLPFDKVILERGQQPGSEADDCVHIQYRLGQGRRLAFLGSTHGAGAYTPAEVAA
jgi:hypothetical protein